MSDQRSDNANPALDSAKQSLTASVVYLQLVYSLFPGALTNRDVREAIVGTLEWLDSDPSEDECWRKLPTLHARFWELLQDALRRLPPRRDWREIACEFSQLCHGHAVSWADGLPFGWLAERFDCRPISLPDDMPFHARIGIGHHAGRQAVEEDSFLRDAFYFLVRANRLMDRMQVLQDRNRNRSQEESAAEFLQMRVLGENTATQARTAVLTFHHFVECFVNSVGEDYVLRHPQTASDQAEILQGRRGGRFLSTERKMEMIPQVIRGDGTRPLILTDPAQISEPFATFVTQVKALRDATSHYSPQKERIWLSPQDWLERAEVACQVCLDVARRFWDACYPNRALPSYLLGLSEDRYLSDAIERLEAESA